MWHLVRLMRKEDAYNELGCGLIIGRRLFSREYPDHFGSVLDLTCEVPEPKGGRTGGGYHNLPILDGKVPDRDVLLAMVHDADGWSEPIYIHCAEGHGRACLVTLILLLHRGHAASVEEGLAQITAARPKVRLNRRQRRFASDIRTELVEGAIPFFEEGVSEKRSQILRHAGVLRDDDAEDMLRNLGENRLNKDLEIDR